MRSPFLKALVCWPTFFVVLAISFLLGLGTWQLQRLAWKEAMIAQINKQLAEPPVSIEEVLSCASEPTACEFRKIVVTGHYEHDQEAHLYGRTRGGKPMTHLVTPFVLSSGSVILVDRGWVPESVDMKTLTPVAGELTLHGYIRQKSARNTFTPDNNYEKNRLFSVDPTEWAHEKKATTLLPFYLVLEVKDSDQLFPRPSDALTLGLRNFHLSYAITWYMLALALLVLYVFYIRKNISTAPPQREDE
ncbi:MAG: hypothetical protein H2057_00930 [Alphaproteobacteria bacterium]|nr:hypothetical protein [Alphaproteobacteria bacterium]